MANITLMGASYSDVPAVNLPKTGGGMATFLEVAGSQTFTENGTFDVSTLAQAIVNVAGGGGGLVYETGTWTPSEDIARGTVSFSGTHTDPPFLVCMSDVTNTTSSVANSNHVFCFFDPDRAFGVGFPFTFSGYRYAVAYYCYRGSSSSQLSSSGTTCSERTTSTSSKSTIYPKYWATKSEFHPYTNSTGRYWRSGRTFKWYAVWLP